MTYQIPPKPVEIRKMLDECPTKDRQILYQTLWTANGERNFPKYLWDFWKDELKKIGYTWQSFLNVLRGFKRDIHKWINGELSWEDLVKRIIRELEARK